MSDARIRRLEQAYRLDPNEANRLAWLNAKRAVGDDEGLEPPPQVEGLRVMVRAYRGKLPKHCEGRGPVDELKRAQEVFFCGTTTEISQTVEIDGRQVGDGAAGPITTRLYEEFVSRTQTMLSGD